jgi:hypothetical protein
MTLFALIGATALWLTYAWLLSAIVASYLSHRKGYGERPGLASGLLLNFVGVIVWLVVPPKAGSLWRQVGPYGSTRKKGRPSEAVAEGPRSASPPGTEGPTPEG